MGGGVYIAQPGPFAALDRQEALHRVQDNPSPAFRSNVATITNEAAANGARVLLVGFLQAPRERLSTNRPDLAGFEDAFVAGVDKHDRIMADIAATYHQRFLRLDRSRFPDDWFLDNCHLKEPGEAEKSRQISEAVLALLKTDAADGQDRP